jgi:hypothetical protein
MPVESTASRTPRGVFNSLMYLVNPVSREVDQSPRHSGFGGKKKWVQWPYSGARISASLITFVHFAISDLM